MVTSGNLRQNEHDRGINHLVLSAPRDAICASETYTSVLLIFAINYTDGFWTESSSYLMYKRIGLRSSLTVISPWNAFLFLVDEFSGVPGRC